MFYDIAIFVLLYADICYMCVHVLVVGRHLCHPWASYELGRVSRTAIVIILLVGTLANSLLYIRHYYNIFFVRASMFSARDQLPARVRGFDMRMVMVM